MRPILLSQKAFSVVLSRRFKRWTRRDHSDDPKVVFNDQGKDRGNAPGRVNSNALGKGNARRVNSNALGKDNGPGRVNSNALDKDNGPGGWTDRGAGDRA